MGYSPQGHKELDTAEQLTSSLSIVSSGQQSYSVTHIHAFFLSQISLPSKLPYNIEQSFLYFDSVDV